MRYIGIRPASSHIRVRQNGFKVTSGLAAVVWDRGAFVFWGYSGLLSTVLLMLKGVFGRWRCEHELNTRSGLAELRSVIFSNQIDRCWLLLATLHSRAKTGKTDALVNNAILYKWFSNRIPPFQVFNMFKRLIDFMLYCYRSWCLYVEFEKKSIKDYKSYWRMLYWDQGCCNPVVLWKKTVPSRPVPSHGITRILKGFLKKPVPSRPTGLSLPWL